MYSDRSRARCICAPTYALFRQARLNTKALTVWLAEVLYACEKHDVAAGCGGYRTVNG